jgi:hypothetical protein
MCVNMYMYTHFETMDKGWARVMKETMCVCAIVCVCLLANHNTLYKNIQHMHTDACTCVKNT